MIGFGFSCSQEDHPDSPYHGDCAKRKNVGVNGHKSEIRNPKSEPSSEIFHPNLALDFADFGLVLGMISSLNLTLPPGLNFRSLGFFQCNGTSDEEPGDKPN